MPNASQPRRLLGLSGVGSGPTEVSWIQPQGAPSVTPGGTRSLAARLRRLPSLDTDVLSRGLPRQRVPDRLR
jgi:hypothetical protein